MGESREYNQSTYARARERKLNSESRFLFKKVCNIFECVHQPCASCAAYKSRIKVLVVIGVYKLILILGMENQWGMNLKKDDALQI